MRVKLTVIKAIFFCKLGSSFNSTIENTNPSSHLLQYINNSLCSSTGTNYSNLFMLNLYRAKKLFKSAAEAWSICIIAKPFIILSYKCITCAYLSNLRRLLMNVVHYRFFMRNGNRKTFYSSPLTERQGIRNQLRTERNVNCIKFFCSKTFIMNLRT